MNNTFFDNHYQIGFLIPFERQLTTQEAEIIARQVISNQKEVFYQVWKSKLENKDWSGDIEAKKEELFIENHKTKAPIFVFGRSIAEILKDGPQPNE